MDTNRLPGLDELSATPILQRRTCIQRGLGGWAGGLIAGGWVGGCALQGNVCEPGKQEEWLRPRPLYSAGQHKEATQHQ